ncbi:MAG: hypothetical protein ACI9BF_000215 [Candidatus Paceibacteria bacterium]|jgi:hypothetical protein
MDNIKVNNITIMTIPKSLLLCVFLILPILLCIALADKFYFNSALLPYVGLSALYLPVFILVFVLPHIIASFFSFFDHEYVHYYRRHLFLYLPVLLIATAALLYTNYILGVIFFLLYDFWHGVKQNVGISLILGARPGWLHRAWTLIPFLAGGVAVVYIVRPSAYPAEFIPYISPVLFFGAILMVLSTAAMMWKASTAARWHILGVSMLFLFGYYFILAGYIFFAILAFRFTHDVSAFAFYVTHDNNRKKGGKTNWFYRLFGSMPVPTLILTPLLALALAYVVRTATDGLAIGYSIVILIAISHFYLEGVMWKRDSPHRQYVKVV